MFSELPVVSVHIPPNLRALAGGSIEVMASGETVGQVVEAVGHQYPEWYSSVVRADGHLADDVAVYLGGVAVRALQGLETPIGFEESLNIVWTGVAFRREAVLPHAFAHVPTEHAISIGES